MTVSRHIARIMCQQAQIIANECIIPQFPQKRIKFSFRIGSGKRTYHQKTLDNGNESNHSITFGQKMITSKMDEHERQRWLSTREIREMGYAGGNTDYASTLAHTVVHEVAHALQSIKGGRTYGSVHNRHFYRCLDEIYKSHGETVHQAVREAVQSVQGMIEKQMPSQGSQHGNQNGQLANKPVGYDRSNVRNGGFITFSVNNGEKIEAQITRKNQKTVTAEYAKGSYRVPYARIERYSESPENARSAMAPKARKPASAPRAGQTIEFEDKGKTIKARIVRANKKTVTAVTGAIQYRVPYPLISQVHQ